MPERKYSERELAEILKLASIEQVKGSAPGDQDGYSLHEIERIAVEVGIEPENVGVAIGLLKSPEPVKEDFSLLGPAKGLTVKRTFAGPLSDAAWIELVSEFRKIFRGPGTLSETGSTRQWTCEVGGIAAQVSSTPSEGSTRIHVDFGVTSTFEGQILSLVCSGIAFSLVLGGVIVWLSIQTHQSSLSGIAAVLAIAFLMVGLGALFRFAFTDATKKALVRVEALLDRTSNSSGESVHNTSLDLAGISQSEPRSSEDMSNH